MNPTSVRQAALADLEELATLFDQYRQFQGIFVQESGRRKGLASKLLSALESYAWSLGTARVTLNVARGNASAQRLYEERGWKQDDQFFMYHHFPESLS